MNLEWRNPWFQSEWKALAAKTLEEAARELPMPHHEETIVRDKDTGQTYRRSS